MSRYGRGMDTGERERERERERESTFDQDISAHNKVAWSSMLSICCAVGGGGIWR